MPVRPDGNRFHIVVVEDVESILLAIRDFLIREFQVSAFSDFEEARNFLSGENVEIDVLISDVSLPGGSGFDLVEEIRKKNMKTEVILVTAYNINEYVDLIRSLGITQILTKHSHLSLQDIYITIYKLLTKDIFGVDKYFPGARVYFPSEMPEKTVPDPGEIFSVRIRNTNERIEWTDRIGKIMLDQLGVSESVSKLVLDEMITNAMVRAAKKSDGSYKYQKVIPEKDMLVVDDYVQLEEEDYVLLQYGTHGDWMILACQDPHGTLEKDEVLYRLRRHIVPNERTGFPDGLTDTHGRGIFLMRDQLTHLVYNVQRSKKTEVIGLYNTKHSIPYKNISIYVID